MDGLFSQKGQVFVVRRALYGLKSSSSSFQSFNSLGLNLDFALQRRRRMNHTTTLKTSVVLLKVVSGVY